MKQVDIMKEAKYTDEQEYIVKPTFSILILLCVGGDGKLESQRTSPHISY